MVHTTLYIGNFHNFSMNRVLHNINVDHPHLGYEHLDHFFISRCRSNKNKILLTKRNTGKPQKHIHEFESKQYTQISN